MGSLDHSGLAFDGPSSTHKFHGLLFDFDGTIIDSTDAIIKHWHKIGRELGVDPEVILATSHGRRSIDTLRAYDESKANWEYVSYIEGLIPLEYGSSATEIPGARKLLSALDTASVPWAICTSGTTALATGWIKVMNLSRPAHMVVAEDVQNGKPDPECYLMGAQKLGLLPTSKTPSSSPAPAPSASPSQPERQILVIEDAPAGVRSGKAAGFKVLGLATTHDVKKLKEAGADWIVRDLRSLVLKAWDGTEGLASVEILDALTN